MLGTVTPTFPGCCGNQVATTTEYVVSNRRPINESISSNFVGGAM